jgi:hypothetical protein
MNVHLANLERSPVVVPPGIRDSGFRRGASDLWREMR